VLSFVCSIGNVPLAAVLWSGGISFAGVIAFIFADLIVLPIISAYRKYYGWPFALRITALMFVTIVLAALVVDAIFTGASLVPDTRTYKLILNTFGVIVFVGLLYLTRRRGAADPVCGMRVDRAKALRSEHAGSAAFFCSEQCQRQLESDPERYTLDGQAPVRPTVAAHSR